MSAKDYSEFLDNNLFESGKHNENFTKLMLLVSMISYNKFLDSYGNDTFCFFQKAIDIGDLGPFQENSLGYTFAHYDVSPGKRCKKYVLDKYSAHFAQTTSITEKGIWRIVLEYML